MHIEAFLKPFCFPIQTLGNGPAESVALTDSPQMYFLAHKTIYITFRPSDLEKTPHETDYVSSFGSQKKLHLDGYKHHFI